MRNPGQPLSVLLACACVASGAPLEQPTPAAEKRQPPPVRVLVDRALQETPVRLLKITESSISFTPLSEPADAPARVQALGEVLALLPPSGAPPLPRALSREAAPLVAVATIDGQRLVGHIRAPTAGEGAAEGGAPLILESAVFGRVTLALDLVLGVEMIESGDQTPLEPGNDDTVLLVNGDRIDGFIDSVGPVVTIRPAGSEEDVKIPLERARRILLANRPVQSAGTLLWLLDGGVVALQGPPESDGQVLKCRLAHNGAAFNTPLSAARALALDARQVRPLGSIPMHGYTPAPERRWTRPPRVLDSRSAPLGAADIEIPGPMSVEWVLPSGASRVVGIAELGRSTQGWGDCEVSIEDLTQGAPARRLFSKRLSAQETSARFDVALGPSTSTEHRLRVTVEPGQRGPIQDRVYLRRPLLLLSGGQER